ncbi:hypothetical protein DEJ03_08465 [Curtobacterium sp. MCLR17_043]|nr:hypothetical protein DEJ03_08465 [Curtobacterium sp. MCLR17_043]
MHHTRGSDKIVESAGRSTSDSNPLLKPTEMNAFLLGFRMLAKNKSDMVASLARGLRDEAGVEEPVTCRIRLDDHRATNPWHHASHRNVTTFSF